MAKSCWRTSVHDTGVVQDIYVTQGDIEILLGGRWKPYGCGDGIRFRADQPHGYRNLTDQQAQLHNPMHYSGTTLYAGTANCLSEIHEEARVCASCGTRKGASHGGVTSGDLKFRATVVAGVGFLPLVGALGFLISGDGIGFMLLGVVSLIPICLAVVIFLMSGSKEKWYRW